MCKAAAAQSKACEDSAERGRSGRAQLPGLAESKSSVRLARKNLGEMSLI